MKKITVIVQDDIVSTIVGLIAEHAVELHVRSWEPAAPAENLLSIPAPAPQSPRQYAEKRIILDSNMGKVSKMSKVTRHYENIKTDDQIMLILQEVGEKGWFYPDIQKYFTDKGYAANTPRTALSKLIKKAKVVGFGPTRQEVFYLIEHSPYAKAS